MKNFKYLFISVYLLTACVKDLPENNPFIGTPIVATYSVYQSFPISFKVEGGIISTDDEEIIEKGFCWSTDTLPTILNQKTSVTFKSSGWEDRFYSKITDFQQGTLYHIRSYAKTNFRVVYGNDISFTTNGYSKNIKDIDGNIYNTVNIGGQVWMAENLKVSKFNNGTPIPNITDDNLWRNTFQSARCNYENNISNNEIYGKLYNSFTITSNLNVCPQGWRVPKIEDWETLLVNVRTSEAWESNNNATNLKADSDNIFYFSALKGGYRSKDGQWLNIESNGNWWSFKSENTLYQIEMDYSSNVKLTTIDNYLYRTQGLSIRCIKD
jgi:uncharacterized protein (TIGR02145 family)